MPVDDMQDIPENRNSACRRVPVYFIVILVLAMLPGFLYPMFLSAIKTGDVVVKGLVWFYPAYVLISGFLSWQCYGRRTVMSWIILVLLTLSHACFCYMSYVPVSGFPNG